ncbi:hypothetical protein BGZ46_006123, partial [Entomortierella lignicola]
PQQILQKNRIIMGLLSSFHRPPKELLELANTNLDNARKETSTNKALKLIKKAKTKIQKAEKSFPTSAVKDSSLKDDIANAYQKHGELLNKLGNHNEAQESHNMAEKWRYTHLANGHDISLQDEDKSGYSDQSTSHLVSSTVIKSPITPNHQASAPNTTPSISNDLAKETASSRAQRDRTTRNGDIGHIP